MSTTTSRRVASTAPRHVAIVGSRHIIDYRKFCSTVRPIVRPTDILVSGGADGVDSMARKFADQNGHEFVEHVVDQKRIRQLQFEGKDRLVAFAIAANERNQKVVDELTGDRDIMIAIACVHSKGTLDAINRMRARSRTRDYQFTGKSIEFFSLFNYLWYCPQDKPKD